MNHDTVLDPDRLPHDPLMPKGDVLIDIFSRITSMSDALYSPEGTLQIRLKEQDNMATLRHMAVMNMLRKVLSEVLEIKARLELVEDTVDTHDARFTLLNRQSAHTEIQ